MHPSTDSKSTHAYGAQSPHVAPAHGAAHACGGAGDGDCGGDGGSGDGGSSTTSWQQPEQSHDHGGCASSGHGVVRKAAQVPPLHGFRHAAGTGVAGDGGGGLGGAGSSFAPRQQPLHSQPSISTNWSHLLRQHGRRGSERPQSEACGPAAGLGAPEGVERAAGGPRARLGALCRLRRRRRRARRRRMRRRRASAVGGEAARVRGVDGAGRVVRRAVATPPDGRLKSGGGRWGGSGAGRMSDVAAVPSRERVTRALFERGCSTAPG